MTNRLKQEIHFQGCILVAAPSWNSGLYARCVCLLVHHGEEGSVGVFLNRSMSESPADLWEHLAGDAGKSMHRTLHFGGPKSGPVIAVHNRPDLAEFASADGVYFAAQLENLQRLLAAEDKAEVRIIVGQAAWKPGELDNELREGKWLPIPVTPQLVFSNEDEMWGRAMRQIGNHYVVAITGATGQPTSPLLN